MTRSDVAVIIVVYAICLLFLYFTLQLIPAARIYPLCLIGGLALLDTLFLIQRLAALNRLRKSGGSGITNDFGETFKGFQAGQFSFVVGACIAYIICLYVIGFYPTSILFLAVVMWFLKVKPLPMSISIIILGVLVYCVFTRFLKVPLPTGFLFS